MRRDNGNAIAYIAHVQYLVRSMPKAAVATSAAAAAAGVPLRYLPKDDGPIAPREQEVPLPFLFAMCELTRAQDVGFRFDDAPRLRSLHEALQPHGVDVRGTVAHVNASRVAQLHRVELKKLATPKQHPDQRTLVALDISDAPPQERDKHSVWEANERAHRVGKTIMPLAAESVMRIDPCRSHPSEFGVPQREALQMVGDQKHVYFGPVFGTGGGSIGKSVSTW